MKPPLRGLIEHEVHLDILCCLDDGEPLTSIAIGARIGKPTDVVKRFLTLLDSYGVVRRTGDRQGVELLYEACLDEQPAWVRAAVEKHRSQG